MVCTAIVVQILQRCSRRSSDGASEFRPILFNLVEDLLAVQLHPEYPGSETFLSSLCRGLTNDLLCCTSGGSGNTTSKNGTSSLEPTYIATAMDVLGKIASSTAYQLRVHKENHLTRWERAHKSPNQPLLLPIMMKASRINVFAAENVW